MSWACQCLPLMCFRRVMSMSMYILNPIPAYNIFSQYLYFKLKTQMLFSHRHLPIFSLQNCRMDVMILKWLGALLSLLVCHLLALFFRLVFHSHITRVLRLSYLKYDLIYVFGADSVNAMQWAPNAAYAHITT